MTERSRGEVFIEQTKSICPLCKTVVDAELNIREGRVYVRKRCREHGGFEALASALVLLLGAVAAHRPDLGVFLVFGFGIGMATTLVGAGAALVATSRALERATLSPRLLRLAPIVAAVTVLAVGLGLTAQSLAALL